MKMKLSHSDLKKRKLTHAPDNRVGLEDEFYDNSGDCGSSFSFQPVNFDMEYTPQNASIALQNMGISEANTSCGITCIPDQTTLQQHEATQKICNRFCWVAPVDEKGSTPVILKKLLYVLNMARKFYAYVPKGANAKNAPFEPKNVVPNDACVHYRNGMAFHYVTTGEDFETHTMPIFNISIFIDNASTGGVSAFNQAYMFVCLEVPITFDLCEVVSMTNKHVKDQDGTYICEVMKSFWVDIANHQQMMDGENKAMNIQNFMRIQYEDLFDELSNFCFWKIFRIAKCISAARRHMHLMAVQYRHEKFGENWKQASKNVQVRFSTIDQFIEGRHDPYRYDLFWAKMSDITSVVQYRNFEEYKAMAERHNKKRKLNGGKGKQEDDEMQEVDEEEPLMPWNPPVIIDVPTFIDYEHEETRNFLRHCMAEDSLDVDNFLEFVTQEHPGRIKMQGFPEAVMCASVEFNLFKPDTCKFLKYEDWLAINPCSLPSKMTLPILLMKDQKHMIDADSVGDPFAIFSSIESNLPRNCIHMEDYRQFLKTGGSSVNFKRPMKGRCAHIYKMQSDAIKKIPNAVKRVECMYDSYISSTVLPLCFANIRSDNGEMGGSDARLSIISDIAGRVCDDMNSPYQCRIAEKFCNGMELIKTNAHESLEVLNYCRGTMQSAESLLYYMHELKNINGNLKPGNLQMNMMLFDSDIGYYLNYLNSYWQMAKNGIGLVLWCQNFCGMAGTREKTRGTGVDEAINQFINSQHPANSDPPTDVDLSKYPVTSETKGASSTALFSKYSCTVSKNGERLDSITENPPNLWLTEMKMDMRGENPMWASLNDNIFRNTSAGSLGKRDVVVQDNNGRWINTEQVLIVQPRILAVATNANDQSHYATTVQAVCCIVAAGGVDLDDSNKHRGKKFFARQDMGQQAKYLGKNEISWVKSVSGMLSRDMTTCAAMSAFVSSCNFFGTNGELKVMSGVETCWQEVVVSLVHHHRPFMNARASCAQNWNRIVDMAKTRILPYALQVHSTFTLSHPSVKSKSWPDILKTTLVNFLANPVPSQVIPMFTANLLATSFDWMLFVLLGIFIDMFKVPAMDSTVAENMFSDPEFVVPEKDAKPIRKWLQSIGATQTVASAPKRKFDLIVASSDSTQMEKTALYVSCTFEDGADVTSLPLVCNVEQSRQSNFSDDNKSLTPSDRVCQSVAKILAKKNASKLKSSCNIADEEKGSYRAFHPLKDCLSKYSTQAIAYHKFGKVPSGRGFNSVLQLFKSLGVTNPKTFHGFVDANDPNFVQDSLDGYKTTPFLIKQCNGQIYQLGVDFRWLLWVKSIYGNRPSISQSSIQAIFQHLTEQFIMNRIPTTLFPSNHIFTGMVSSEKGGLEHRKLPMHTRTKTMLRPAPDAIVIDKKTKTLCGLLPGLSMPEDFNSVEALKRVAGSVSDETCVVKPEEVMLQDLKPPLLPLNQFVYVEVKFRDRNGVYPGVVFTHANMDSTLYVDEEHSTSDFAITRTDHEGTLAHQKLCFSNLGVLQRSLKTLQSGEMWYVLSHTPEYFIHFKPVFARPGILVKIDNVFAVVTEWDENAVDGDARYVNPCSLGYLAVLNSLQFESLAWPRVEEKFEWSWNIPPCKMMDCIVDIGSKLYLDLNAPEVTQILSNGISSVGYVGTSDQMICGATFGMSCEDFFQQIGTRNLDDEKWLPVIQVTLIYELPEEVLISDATHSHKESVYIGFNVMSKRGQTCLTHNIQYAAVQPRSLIPTSRIDECQLEAVPFAFFE